MFPFYQDTYGNLLQMFKQDSDEALQGQRQVIFLNGYKNFKSW